MHNYYYNLMNSPFNSTVSLLVLAHRTRMVSDQRPVIVQVSVLYHTVETERICVILSFFPPPLTFLNQREKIVKYKVIFSVLILPHLLFGFLMSPSSSHAPAIYNLPEN